MRKILSTLVCGAMLATVASADLSRVEMGVGMWNQTPGGTMSYSDGTGATGTYNSNAKENSSAYAWLLIKHPIPIVPNLRLEYASVKDDGIVSGSFKDFTVPGATTTASMEIAEYDVIPYYNILDNTFWTTVDLGLDIKVLQTNYKADGVNINGVGLGNYDDKVSLALPLVYARARVEIPGTNIGLEADGKYITYDGSSISDARIKADFTLGFIPVVQPALEIGYRVQKFDLKYEDGADVTKVKLDFSGLYAGVMVRF